MSDKKRDKGKNKKKKPEELTTLERLHQGYKSEEEYERLAIARSLPEAIQELGLAQSKNHILPMMDELSCDVNSEVRKMLVDQILPACQIFTKWQAKGAQVNTDTLFPLLVSKLSDDEEEIRASVCMTIEEFALCNILKKDVMVQQIWPEIERLSNVAEAPSRAISVELMSRLAPVLGKEKTLAYSLQKLDKLKTDEDFIVRQAIPIHMTRICEVLGEELTTTKMLPIFDKLCKDEIWCVRKACAEALVSLSQLVRKDKRLGLVLSFVGFVESDATRWVRTAALSSVGPFISTFPRGDVVQVLLDKYNTLADDNPDGEFYDYEMLAKCAHSFPAVLVTLGKEGWPALAKTYQKLALDYNWQTRYSIASSMHIVAGIVEKNITDSALMPIIKSEYINDIDDIRIGILTNLVRLLQVLEDLRLGHMWVLNWLGELQQNSFWRYRELIAKQLGELASMYNYSVVASKLVPLCKDLIMDPVAYVRREIYKQIPSLLEALSPSKEEYEKFVHYLQTLGQPTEHWHSRLLYVKMCPSLQAHSVKLFDQFFLEQLCNLATDPVPNIRLQVAKAILRFATSYTSNPHVNKAIRALSEDPDSDVKALKIGVGKANVPTKSLLSSV